MGAATLFDKIWDRHVVSDLGDGYALLHVSRHLMHDGGASAVQGAQGEGLPRPQSGPDLRHLRPCHIDPAGPHGGDQPGADAAASTACARRQGGGRAPVRPRRARSGHRARDRAGAGPDAPRHAAACAATATPARTAAWARWRSASARARSCTCWRRKPSCSAARSGCAQPSRARSRRGVTPKDMILHLIGVIGAAGGTGYAVEYAGQRHPCARCRGAPDDLQPVDRARCQDAA